MHQSSINLPKNDCYAGSRSRSFGNSNEFSNYYLSLFQPLSLVIIIFYAWAVVKCRCCRIAALASCNTIFVDEKSIKESHVPFHSAFSNRAHMNFWSECDWTMFFLRPKFNNVKSIQWSLVNWFMCNVSNTWSGMRSVLFFIQRNYSYKYIGCVEHANVELEKKCRNHVWESVKHGSRIYRLNLTYIILMQDLFIVCIAGSSIFVLKNEHCSNTFVLGNSFVWHFNCVVALRHFPHLLAYSMLTLRYWHFRLLNYLNVVCH